jgi:sialate O-acetylesterase
MKFKRAYVWGWLLVFAMLAGFLRGPAVAADLSPTALLAAIKAGEGRKEIPCPIGAETELWLLAGQSNMYGMGILDEELPADPQIQLFRMNNTWDVAREPIHNQLESIFGVHRLLQKNKDGSAWSVDDQVAAYAKNLKRPATERNRCVGPGLFFAHDLRAEIKNPIGLIPTAHGGTTLAQWSPELKNKGTDSLYGAMLARARLTQAGGKGGHLRGMLWYQGESDAITPAIKLRSDGTSETVGEAYTRQWLAFIDAVRADLGQPELPILYVQIGRRCQLDDKEGPAWEEVREAQRLTMTQRPNLYMIPAVDQSYDDPIHVSAAGQHVIGKRLAEVALDKVYHRPGHATLIEVASVENLGPEPNTYRPNRTIRVKFRGVNGRLKAEGRPTGFTLRRKPGMETVGGSNLHSVTFDPQDSGAVLIKLRSTRFDYLNLYYAPGCDPYVNITDEKGMGLPAFGPLPLPEPGKKNEYSSDKAAH